MPSKTKFVFVASMDVDPEKEDLFNEIYETEHIPILSKVPGVLSIYRSKTEAPTMIMGGEQRTMDTGGAPKYSAMYEIESPDVLLSDAWVDAVDQGRWADEVRPFTHNRRHVLHRIIGESS